MGYFEEMEKYREFVASRLESGEDPNVMADRIEKALREVATDWVLWGDGVWRPDTVCPTCGSSGAGVCGHRERPVLRREFHAG